MLCFLHLSVKYMRLLLDGQKFKFWETGNFLVWLVWVSIVPVIPVPVGTKKKKKDDYTCISAKAGTIYIDALRIEK